MFYIAVITIISLLLQTQLIPVLGLRIDLLFIVVVYYGLLYGWKTGVVSGLIIGLVQDVFSNGILGASCVGLSVCGMFAGYTRGMLLLKYRTVRIILIVLLTFLNLLIYLVLINAFSSVKFNNVFEARWFDVCIQNGIAAGIIFWLVDRYG